jgi:tetratricopeptide (TPR) repeat protein
LEAAAPPEPEISVENAVLPGQPAAPAMRLDVGAGPPAAPGRLAELLKQANEHEQAGRLDAAETALKEILAAAPEQPAALHMLGIIAYRRGHQEEAAKLMERSIARAPANALFRRNICEVYRMLCRYDEAAAAGRRAATLDPRDRHAHHNLGVVHYHRREPDKAIASIERALALAPDFADAHLGLAEALLMKGEFARGWVEYEWRYKIGSAPQLMPPTDRPQWDGTPIADGTLLLIADQGYGDVVLFARYLPWAAERCRDIVVACSREVRAIVEQQPGIRMAFDRWDVCPRFAAFSALSSLAWLHGTRLDTIPAEVPYLRADPKKAAEWSARLAALVPHGYRRIGLCWGGRPNPNPHRSTDLATLAPLAELRNTALLSLQKGPAQSQIGGYWGRAPLINLGPEIRDFADTMAIIENLDLVVTIDTALAHLAGAMGKPVWVMLIFGADWRWFLDRSDSPWYPTARLFRQSAPRRWDPLVAQIAAELA